LKFEIFAHAIIYDVVTLGSKLSKHAKQQHETMGYMGCPYIK